MISVTIGVVYLKPQVHTVLTNVPLISGHPFILKSQFPPVHPLLWYVIEPWQVFCLLGAGLPRDESGVRLGIRITGRMYL